MLQKVVRSTVIDAPIERVWQVLRDFNSHDQWHDVVETSRIEAGESSAQVGCVRSFTLKDGNRIREQLLTLDDREHKSTYCIVEATVPLQRYVATVTLRPVTDGNRTFWHWESSFATPPGRERELREMVARDVYEAGFANLRRHLQQGADLRTPRSAPLPTALPLPTRRIVLRGYGGADQLTTIDGEAAAPGPGEVRIRQRAIGVNFIDVYLRRGWIPSMLQPGGTPGMEAAGSVLDIGAGVTGLLPGDRVACIGPVPGAYCSVRTVPVDGVVRLPRGSRRRGGRRAAAQGSHRALPGARPRPRHPRHAVAGARGRRRRGAAGVRLGTALGGHRDWHRVERGQGAHRARTRLRTRHRHPRLPVCRCGAGHLRWRRRGDRRLGRRGVRREPGRARAVRALDQPRASQRPAARDRCKPAGAQVAELLAARGVCLHRHAPGARRRAPRACGRRWPMARSRRRRSNAMRSTRPRRRMRGWSRVRRWARWCSSLEGLRRNESNQPETIA